MKANTHERSNRESGSKGVKSNPDAAQGLRELLEEHLQDIYWAEKAITKAMPQLIENVTTPELIEALSEHLEITEQQVRRVEEVFKALRMKAEAKKCVAMEGLLKEAQEVMKSTEEGVVRDAGIIAAAQKVEHYEIASYGTLHSFAALLGEDEAASLLEQTLNEEKEADANLTAVSEAINIEAVD
ncbi:MAG TPA: ferritin-like domain-containing protein [Prolixibacteraceae bacterium]|nr:ferritin-like domain-containing protein [Prolixibacteraceae bacterium]